jgi:hypothetical protein
MEPTGRNDWIRSKTRELERSLKKLLLAVATVESIDSAMLGVGVEDLESISEREMSSPISKSSTLMIGIIAGLGGSGIAAASSTALMISPGDAEAILGSYEGIL